MGATVVEKIARAHMVEGPDRPLRPGDMVMLRPRHLLTHDNTSAVMSKFRSIGGDAGPRSAAAGDRAGPRDPEPVPGEPGEVRADPGVRREHGLDFHPAGAASATRS
jgi:homoaconitate hydratase